MIPDEDFLYEKARLKIAAEEIRKLVNGALFSSCNSRKPLSDIGSVYADGYKTQEPTEVRRDIYWLLEQLVDGQYLKEAVRRHCDSVYNLDEDEFITDAAKIKRTQLQQQPAKRLAEIAHRIMSGLHQMKQGMSPISRIKQRINELCDILQAPAWVQSIVESRESISLQRRQELVSYLQHVAERFQAVVSGYCVFTHWGS